MKTRTAIALLLVSTSVAAAPPSPPAVDARLGWLAGCWQGSDKASSSREVWMSGGPGLLLGMGSTQTPGKPPEFEFLRIEGHPGGPAYVAQPGGAPPVAFEFSADQSTADTTVFVNLQHDFPKRIAYQHQPSGALLA